MAKLLPEKKIRLRKQLLEYLKNADNINYTISEYNLFGNYNGLRLSENGNKIMKSVFDFYLFPLEQKLTIRDILKLNNNMNSFFYIGEKSIVIYDHHEATYINLLGDIKLWINSISL